MGTSPRKMILYFTRAQFVESIRFVQCKSMGHLSFIKPPNIKLIKEELL